MGLSKQASFVIPSLVEWSGECLGKDRSTMTQRSVESFLGTVLKGGMVVSTSNGDVVLRGPSMNLWPIPFLKKHPPALESQRHGTFMVFACMSEGLRITFKIYRTAMTQQQQDVLVMIVRQLSLKELKIKIAGDRNPATFKIRLTWFMPRHTAWGQLKSGTSGWPINKRCSRLLRWEYTCALYMEYTTCHLLFHSN